MVRYRASLGGHVAHYLFGWTDDDKIFWRRRRASQGTELRHYGQFYVASLRIRSTAITNSSTV